jgi:prepilin-type N-terminal cleavage/methylation domain-containing protein
MKWPIFSDTAEGKGFTLMEVLIAIFILVTVLSTIYASYTGTLRIVEETQSQAEIYQVARIALERITEDLESLYISTKTRDALSGPAGLEDDEELVGFEGEANEIAGERADSMRFFSRAHLVFGEQDLPCGTAEIGYYVEEDDTAESLVLYRTDRLKVEEALEERAGGLPLCEGLASVGFTYFDADGEEYEDWEEPEKGAPRIVSISLEFVNPSDEENPLKFVTSVALPLSEV